MLKYILIAVAVVVIVIGGIVLLVFNATSGLTDTADKFFTSLAAKDYKAAYSFLSKDFQAKTSPDDLKENFINSEIKNYSSANWNNRSFENNVGKLEGEIKTDAGATIPVNLVFVKENDEWKINSIDKLPSGFVNRSEDKNPKIPNEIELRLITKDIILALGNSINNKDFTEFWSIISYTWSTQTKPDELRKAFSSFEEQNINITDFPNQAEAVFDKVPAIDEDGLLVLSGYYPLQNKRLVFILKFIYEHPKWKLISINIKTK